MRREPLYPTIGETQIITNLVHNNMVTAYKGAGLPDKPRGFQDLHPGDGVFSNPSTLLQ